MDGISDRLMSFRLFFYQDYELVRLQEDVTLAGFTPLKNYQLDPVFCRSDIDIEIAQV